MKTSVAALGVVESVCPYCGCVLANKPEKTAKCPHCKNRIHVVTRPTGRIKVLATDEQAEEIKRLRAVLADIHHADLPRDARFMEQAAKLEKRYGSPPSDADVCWSLLNEESFALAKAGNWGGYRNIRFFMGEMLRQELRLEAALGTYLEVCYLDLNGPSTPYFSVKLAFLAPGVIDRAQRVIRFLGLDHDRVKALFDEIAPVHFQSLRLPLSPKGAWCQIESQLFGG